MTESIPPCPVGSDREATFMKWVWRKLARELKFNDTATVKVDRRTDGVYFNARVNPPSPADPQVFIVQVLLEQDDVLLCTDATLTPYTVLKPFSLCRSLYDPTIDGQATVKMPEGLHTYSYVNFQPRKDSCVTKFQATPFLETQVEFPIYQLSNQANNYNGEFLKVEKSATNLSPNPIVVAAQTLNLFYNGAVRTFKFPALTTANPGFLMDSNQAGRTWWNQLGQCPQGGFYLAAISTPYANVIAPGFSG